MSVRDPHLHASMPSPAPLPMPTQDFRRPAEARDRVPEPVAGTHFYRWAVFIPAFLTVAVLIGIFADWFGKGGFQPAEIALLVLVAFSGFWIALSVSTGTIGMLRAKQAPELAPLSPAAALDVALLVPVYNECPRSVFKRLRAMQSELAHDPTRHRFAFFVLSDTRDEAVAVAEWREFRHLARRSPDRLPLFYRRRADNTERKTGNIRDWIENWGAAWDAFVTLDADSLMSAESLVALADEMAVRSDVGLIQTVPRLIGARTLFGRVQQFASNVYGDVLAHGLERWCGAEGNYWGHNAIIRTEAFAGSAGLPRLSGGGALSGTIKSHDFVEAALLRRAGWGVVLRPSLCESYEEAPQTIVDYVLRDRRWCQGNLQHLRLLGARGLAATSRFHMLQGAMAYVASLVWFFLLILFTLMGKSEEETVFRYFTDDNPLFPQWPETDAVGRAVVLCFVLGLLLLPKLFALTEKIIADPSLKRFGGPVRFGLSALSEIVLSFFLAPILMVQNVMAIARTVANLDTGWEPQDRKGSRIALQTLVRFHWLETLIGSLLFAAIVLQVASPWLLPIAASLLLAIPFSWLTARPVAETPFLSVCMKTPEEIDPPRIIRLSHATRSRQLPKGSFAALQRERSRQPV